MLVDKLEKYKKQLLALEEKLAEQEAYESLKAQGIAGAETEFTRVDRLYKQIERLENKITNIENALR